MDGDIWDFIAPTAGSLLGQAIIPIPGVGAAIGAAVGSGLNTGIKTGDPVAGLEAGAFSGIGSYAGNVIGSEIGDLAGGVLNQSPAEALSFNPENSISDFFNQSTIGGIAGSSIGSSVAQNVGSALLGTSFDTPATKEWRPSHASNSLPTSLSGLGGLTPGQQTSNIATQGIYGGGAGSDENRYFLNLINNRLVDDPNMSNINPIENSYLAKLGLGGYTDPNALLRGIESYSVV